METEQARRRIVHLGVRLIDVSDWIDTAHRGHELMSGFKGIMNQQFLKDLAKHTRKGIVVQVLEATTAEAGPTATASCRSPTRARRTLMDNRSGSAHG
jgi:hypothetical protein